MSRDGAKCASALGESCKRIAAKQRKENAVFLGMESGWRRNASPVPSSRLQDRNCTGTVYNCALSQNSDRAHYPRYSTIRGNFQIVAIYKDFKEISSDNVTTILESPATDSPFSVLQNFPFAERTISRSNPGYACSQSPVKAQHTVRS